MNKRVAALAVFALLCCSGAFSFANAERGGGGDRGGGDRGGGGGRDFGGGGGGGGGSRDFGGGDRGGGDRGGGQQQSRDNNAGQNRDWGNNNNNNGGGGGGDRGFNRDVPDNQIIKNKDGKVPGGGDKGWNSFNNRQFYRPTNFWSGGWTDPYGGVWRSGLYVANIVVGSIAIAGYWSGGCCGCGYFNYYAGNGYGAGVCGYCTFWNGYSCVGMSSYPGWDGSSCVDVSCSTCMYYDPSYGYCVYAPGC